MVGRRGEEDWNPLGEQLLLPPAGDFIRFFFNAEHRLSRTDAPSSVLGDIVSLLAALNESFSPRTTSAACDGGVLPPRGHICPLCTATLPVGMETPGNCQCLLSLVEELLEKQPCWFQDPTLFPKHGNKELCIPQVWTACSRFTQSPE